MTNLEINLYNLYLEITFEGNRIYNEDYKTKKMFPIKEYQISEIVEIIKSLISWADMQNLYITSVVLKDTNIDSTFTLTDILSGLLN